jgi:hypothetical protein
MGRGHASARIDGHRSGLRRQKELRVNLTDQETDPIWSEFSAHARLALMRVRQADAMPIGTTPDQIQAWIARWAIAYGEYEAAHHVLTEIARQRHWPAPPYGRRAP